MRKWQQGRQHFCDRWCTLCGRWSSDQHLSSEKHLKKAALERTYSQEASSKKAGVVEPVNEDTYEDEEFWPPAAADWDTHKRSAWSYYANSWYDNWYEDSWYDDSWYDNSWR